MTTLRLLPFAGLLLATLGACGGPQATQVSAGPDPLAAPTPPGGAAAVASARESRWPKIRLGEEATITGFEGLEVVDTHLVLELVQTSWKELVLDGERERQAYAHVQLSVADEKQALKIREGSSVTVLGHVIECKKAGQTYNPSRGDMIPEAIFVVRVER